MNNDGRLKFGLRLSPDRSATEYVDIAEKAERLGIEYVWVEDEIPSNPFRDPFILLAAVASKTARVKLGTGVTNPYSRHPALVAFGIMTLNELSGGRAFLGLGAGGSMALAPLEIKMWDRPILAVSEAVQVYRLLFAGETVSFQGEMIRMKGVKLFKKPDRPIPIYLAARSPKMLRLSGEVADGVLLSGLPLSRTADAIAEARAGMRLSKRRDNFQVCLSVYFSTSRDGKRARDLVKKHCVFAVADSPTGGLERSGVSREQQEALRQVVRSKGIEAAKGLVTDQMVDSLTVSGEPESCIKACRERTRIGIDQLVFAGPLGPDCNEALKIICREIIPNLK